VHLRIKKIPGYTPDPHEKGMGGNGQEGGSQPAQLQNTSLTSGYMSLFLCAFQMWALSPSIFSLFSDHLLLLDVTIMECYPAVHFAAVQAFHSHCSRLVCCVGITDS
jgi:hypothetical protein